MRPSQTRPPSARTAAAILGLAVALSSSYLRAAEQRGVFALILNGVNRGDILAVLRPSDVLLPAKELAAAGLIGFAGKREIIAAQEFVSLASLAPSVSYEVDTKAVAIRVTARPSLLGTTTVDLRTARPPKGIIYSRNPGFFFNYGVSLENLSQVGVNGETGLSLFGNSLLESTLSRDASGVITRGLTNLTIDDPSDLRQLIIGDTASVSSDPLGGGRLVGGLTLARNFGLNPYNITQPQGTFTGAATTPSEVELYLNGALVHKEKIPPGLFTLKDIPYVPGSGATRVVVRDAFGREQEFTSSYYLNTSVLEPGLAAYGFSVGAVREKLGTENFSYGKAVFSGFGRYGLANWLTPGIRFEATSGVLSGGPRATLATPLGALGLSVGVSQADLIAGGPGLPASTRSASGYAGSAELGYARGRFSIGGVVIYMSPHYANLSLRPEDDRSTFQAAVSLEYPFSERVSITPAYTYTKDRDRGTRQNLIITSNVRLTNKVSLFLSGQYTISSRTPASLGLFGGLSYLLGRDTVASATIERAEGGPAGGQNTYGFGLGKSVPLGPGFGYNLGLQKGPGFQDESARLIDHGDHGSYEFDFDRSNTTTYRFTFSGSLVAFGGRLFAAPPVESAFALIRTDGATNVEGYLFHQPVGRTDSRGDLLITRLIAPYLGDTFGVNDHDIPIDYRIDAKEMVVAPPLRGGALVAFPIRRIRSFVGTLLVQIAGRFVIPKYGTLTMTAAGKTFTSPIGGDGAFFLDSPPVGRFPAKIDFEKGTCSFMIDIPGGERPFIKLGTLRCTM